MKLIWLVSVEYGTFPSFIPHQRCLLSGMYLRENKPILGIRLPGSDPETPSKTVWFLECNFKIFFT